MAKGSQALLFNATAVILLWLAGEELNTRAIIGTLNNIEITAKTTTIEVRTAENSTLTAFYYSKK